MKMNMDKFHRFWGIGILSITQGLLIYLKLNGLAWNWMIILIPLWFVVACFCALIVAGIVLFRKDKEEEPE